MKKPKMARKNPKIVLQNRYGKIKNLKWYEKAPKIVLKIDVLINKT